MLEMWGNMLQRKRFRQVLIFCGIASILYLSKGIFTLIVLTYIFSFLLSRGVKKIKKIVPISHTIITLTIYTGIAGLICLFFMKSVPILANQISNLYDLATSFYQTKDFSNVPLAKELESYIQNFDVISKVESNISTFSHFVKSISELSVNMAWAFVLSLFYVLEIKQIKHFFALFKKEPFTILYNDLSEMFSRFNRIFSSVMTVQFKIVLFDTLLTITSLIFLGFPHIISLSIMLFILSWIPVFGVMLSFIPLSIIAYMQSGLNQVIYILVITICIHLAETYILRPKLMSSQTELPTFFIFVILLLSPEVIGVWGLLLGIPIFLFILDILGIKKIEKDNLKERTQVD